MVDALSENRNTVNVIAETATGRADRVVVVGAHLDSVAEGPGINDNGSGSAAILEIAIQMAELDIEPRNKVRFAWWGAEELGLFGSIHYVERLTKPEIQNIALNLNFDMVGSPNFVRFVYDGDGSDTPLAGPNGSSVIEDIFNDYFASQELADRADRVRRPVRLWSVHRRRHPGRRPVHRCRRHQDRRRGRDLRGHGTELLTMCAIIRRAMISITSANRHSTR